jgi:hypothetical protein
VAEDPEKIMAALLRPYKDQNANISTAPNNTAKTFKPLQIATSTLQPQSRSNNS